MTALMELLLKPEVLFMYGPLGVMAVFLAVALGYLWNRHEALHAQRLSDITKMKDEYVELSEHIEKTLDVLIKVFQSRRGK